MNLAQIEANDVVSGFAAHVLCRELFIACKDRTPRPTQAADQLRRQTEAAGGSEKKEKKRESIIVPNTLAATTMFLPNPSGDDDDIYSPIQLTPDTSPQNSPRAPSASVTNKLKASNTRAKANSGQFEESEEEEAKRLSGFSIRKPEEEENDTSRDEYIPDSDQEEADEEARRAERKKKNREIHQKMREREEQEREEAAAAAGIGGNVGSSSSPSSSPSTGTEAPSSGKAAASRTIKDDRSEQRTHYDDIEAELFGDGATEVAASGAPQSGKGHASSPSSSSSTRMTKMKDDRAESRAHYEDLEKELFGSEATPTSTAPHTSEPVTRHQRQPSESVKRMKDDRSDQRNHYNDIEAELFGDGSESSPTHNETKGGGSSQSKDPVQPDRITIDVGDPITSDMARGNGGGAGSSRRGRGVEEEDDGSETNRLLRAARASEKQLHLAQVEEEKKKPTKMVGSAPPRSEKDITLNRPIVAKEEDDKADRAAEPHDTTNTRTRGSSTQKTSKSIQKFFYAKRKDKVLDRLGVDQGELDLYHENPKAYMQLGLWNANAAGRDRGSTETVRGRFNLMQRFFHRDPSSVEVKSELDSLGVKELKEKLMRYMEETAALREHASVLQSKVDRQVRQLDVVRGELKETRRIAKASTPASGSGLEPPLILQRRPSVLYNAALSAHVNKELWAYLRSKREKVGWAMKRRPFNRLFNRWKNRFTVLTGGTLQYFEKADTDIDPKGILDLMRFQAPQIVRKGDEKSEEEIILRFYPLAADDFVSRSLSTLSIESSEVAESSDGNVKHADSPVDFKSGTNEEETLKWFDAIERNMMFIKYMVSSLYLVWWCPSLSLSLSLSLFVSVCPFRPLSLSFFLSHPLSLSLLPSLSPSLG